MLIGNTDVATIGVKLLKYRITPSQYNGKSYWEAGALAPVLVKGSYTFATLELDIFVQGESGAAVELKKSKLNALMATPTITLDEVDPNIEYLCSYDNQPTVDKINENASIVSYTFKAFKQGKEKSIELKRTTAPQTVNIEGTGETEVIYEITPDVAMAEFSIGDIRVLNLQAGKTLIVNGKKKTVIQDGANKIKDTDFWSFPSLAPGNNQITLSHTGVKVVLKYNPRFV